MLHEGLRIFGQDELAAVLGEALCQSSDSLHPSRAVANAADIDRFHPARIQLNELVVDLRVLLTAVADQNKGEAGLQVQDQPA